MTDEQIKEALTDWVKDYCNNTFLVEEVEALPGGVSLFLEYAIPYIKSNTGKQSETLGDYSVTLSMDFPESMMKLLKPYRKVKFT